MNTKINYITEEVDCDIDFEEPLTPIDAFIKELYKAKKMGATHLKKDVAYK